MPQIWAKRLEYFMNVNVSKRNLICVLIVAFCCMTFYTVMFSLNIKKEINEFIAEEKIKTEATASLPPEALPVQNSIGFKVIKHEKKIGVYAKGTDELLKVLDVYVATLPQFDQELLENGIDVSSERELVSLIEDYTS